MELIGHFSEISNFSDDPDVFIICNDTDFLDISINAKLKLFWINSNINVLIIKIYWSVY